MRKTEKEKLRIQIFSILETNRAAIVKHKNGKYIKIKKIAEDRYTYQEDHWDHVNSTVLVGITHKINEVIKRGYRTAEQLKAM